MSIECPHISDTARLTLQQARMVLGVKDNRTIKRYAAALNIEMHTRKADGRVIIYGKDVKRIWLRIS